MYLSWPVDPVIKKYISEKNKSIRKKGKKIPAGKHFSKNKGVKGLVVVRISRSGHPSYKKIGSGDYLWCV